MFLKNVDSNSGRQCFSSRKQAWSITGRLAVLYVVSTLALLSLTGGFLYLSLVRNMEATRRGMLAGKVQVMRLLLHDHPNQPEALAVEVEHEAAHGQLFRYYIRVLDLNGLTIIETPGMEKHLPPERFQEPVDGTVETTSHINLKLKHHNSFLLVAVKVAEGRTGNMRRVLQIALDAAAGDALLADYRQKLLLMLGAGTVLAALAGVWVAHTGMRPLTRITHAVQRISASQLNDRISTSRWPAELVELAVAFDAMLVRLDDSFTRLAQFSGDLAHALRTPINNLRGEAEVSLTRGRTPEYYQSVICSSLEEFERLSKMIDSLLFVARADDPLTAIQQRRFDARQAIDAVKEFYEALAEERGVSVTCEGNARLTGDPMLFRRACSNLLGNALRYTPVHGSIHLVLSDLGEQGIELCVSDTGCGIAPEHLHRVFDRFYRVEDSPGGTGLGLAIVKSIMRLHGGNVSIQSQIGQGTKVTLKFPPEASV